MATEAAPAPAEISAEQLKKAEEFIEQEEGAMNRFGGWLGKAITAGAVAMSLFHLYAAFFVVPAETLRAIHVGAALLLIFLLYPVAQRFRHRVMIWDVVLAAAAVGTILYLLLGGDDLRDRASVPERTDAIVGAVFILLILEACRRTSGWILLGVVVAFILYALYGNHLPSPWTHRGYDMERLVGHLYITLEGVFGSAVDVSATLIILFTVYGAVLNVTGAGKFYIDFSFAAMGNKPAAAGRTIVVASFLLGGPSGSGVATTVTLGSVAYPMLAKAGYARNAAGGLLAAGGIGAIISPPVLGAAAFLIAEFLKISYLDVILMATIPTCLYYLALLVMVEIDGRKYMIADAGGAQRERGLAAYLRRLGRIYREGGHHFLSLVLIIVFMLAGLTPMLAVVWATALAGLVTFFPPLFGGVIALVSLVGAIVATESQIAVVAEVFQRLVHGPGDVLGRILASIIPQSIVDPLGRVVPDQVWDFLILVVVIVAIAAVAGVVFRASARMRWQQFVAALRDGSIGMLNVAATCASAGIIVGVVTLTGLGLKFSSIIIDYAGGSLILTAIYTAFIVWIVGLAVPVTASYIICAVITAPALIKLGVPDFAAHMFIFYYAVLSEVSPPTALSPFAAAAITGGSPYITTMQAWKYTTPAFVVPLVFVLDPAGAGLLLKMPKGGDVWDVVIVTAQAALGITALAAAFQGWLRYRANAAEIAALALAGAALVAPTILAAILKPLAVVPTQTLAIAGAVFFFVVLAEQLVVTRASPAARSR